MVRSNAARGCALAVIATTLAMATTPVLAQAAAQPPKI
jgi:hypothetical protein